MQKSKKKADLDKAGHIKMLARMYPGLRIAHVDEKHGEFYSVLSKNAGNGTDDMEEEYRVRVSGGADGSFESSGRSFCLSVGFFDQRGVVVVACVPSAYCVSPHGQPATVSPLYCIEIVPRFWTCVLGGESDSRGRVGM